MEEKIEYYEKQKKGKRLHSACFPELGILNAKNTLSDLLKIMPTELNLKIRTLRKKLNEVEDGTVVNYKGGMFVRVKPYSF